MSDHEMPDDGGSIRKTTLYNQTQAAIAAGYGGGYTGAAKAGWLNSKHPKIIRHMRDRVRDMFGTVELTVDRVLIELEEIRVIALREKKVGVALRAVEHKGRYLKMFVDRIEHLHTVEDASSAELTALLGQLMGQIPEIPKSFDELMEQIGGGTHPAATTGDGGSAGSSDADSEGTAPPE